MIVKKKFKYALKKDIFVYYISQGLHFLAATAKKKMVYSIKLCKKILQYLSSIAE